MYELVGYRYCNIPARSRNELDLVGYSCHFLMDEHDNDFTGRSGLKVFLSEEKFPDFKPVLGDKFLLVFNQKGKLIGYDKLDG